MVEVSLEFFFNMVKWVFNDFLIRIKILDIPVLFYFLAIILLGIIISGLINTTNSGRVVFNSSLSSKRADKKRSD